MPRPVHSRERAEHERLRLLNTMLLYVSALSNFTFRAYAGGVSSRVFRTKRLTFLVYVK